MYSTWGGVGRDVVVGCEVIVGWMWGEVGKMELTLQNVWKTEGLSLGLSGGVATPHRK